MDETARIERLRERYGAALIDEGLKQHPTGFLDHIEWSDELDPHYTRLWLEFTYGGVYRRGVLDERTRTLIVVGQFVTLDELDELPVHIRAALAAGWAPREVLEVISHLVVAMQARNNPLNRYFPWRQVRLGPGCGRVGAVLLDSGRILRGRAESV